MTASTSIQQAQGTWPQTHSKVCTRTEVWSFIPAPLHGPPPHIPDKAVHLTGTGRIARFELLPLDSLEPSGRPRIDALCNMSGIFRDSFQNVVELLDDLFRRAGAADEPEDRNFVRCSSSGSNTCMQAHGMAALMAGQAMPCPEWHFKQGLAAVPGRCCLDVTAGMCSCSQHRPSVAFCGCSSEYTRCHPGHNAGIRLVGLQEACAADGGAGAAEPPCTAVQQPCWGLWQHGQRARGHL